MTEPASYWRIMRQAARASKRTAVLREINARALALTVALQKRRTRRRSWVPIGAVIVALVAVAVWIIAWISANLENLWMVQYVDTAVVVLIYILSIGLLGWILLLFFVTDRSQRDRARNAVIAVAGAMMLAVTAYIGYATLRNQMAMQAETDLNQYATKLLEYEMLPDSEIRCLYRNYGYDSAEGCRSTITAQEKTWSQTFFYVEQVIQIFRQASRAEDRWGSEFGETLDYWRVPVEEDFSGMFSYFIVASSENPEAAREAMKQAGICIPNVCAGYQKVLEALPPTARPETLPNWCATADDSRMRIDCKPHSKLQLR